METTLSTGHVLVSGEEQNAVSNPSGILPTEHKVLVKPIKPPEKTAGGIYLADSSKDYAKFTQVRGVIIAIAPLAFNYATVEEWAAAGGTKPKPGDTALYAKNSGDWVKSEKDGEEYLMLNDQDIIATIE